MSIQPTKKYFLIMFLISCVLLEAFTFVIYQQSRSNKKSLDWVMHSYEVLRASRHVLVDAMDIANNEQEYMITGYSWYVPAYCAALEDTNKELAILTKMMADNSDQMKNLLLFRDAIEALEQVTDQPINAAREAKMSVSSRSIGLKATKRAMNDVRAAFENFSQNESDLLAERNRVSDDQQSNYILTLIMGAVLGFGALVVANIIIFSLLSKNTKAEVQLRKSEELFSQVLGGISDGIFDYNVPRNCYYFSPSYEGLLGYTMKEMGTSRADFYRLMHPDDIPPAEERYRQFVSGEVASFTTVFRLRHKNGHWVWILSRGVGARNEAGQLERVIGAHTDISVQMRREEELKTLISAHAAQQQELELAKERAETASQAKDDFLATMSHEIRTPMNVVVGLSNLLLKTPLDGKQQDMMETLCINADILLKLVDDLLNLSRVDSGQIELEKRSYTMDGIFRVLHAMFDAQAIVKGLELTMVNKTGKRAFIGDTTRIQQILANLISNALKFTHAGGIAITAAISGSGTKILLIVADTGAGISSEKLSVIFEKFVQADQTIARRFGGSGLGLSISKSLAQLMGGDIAVTSEPGKGSVFTVSLPLQLDHTRQEAALPEKISPVSDTSASGTILVVEDYPANVMVVTMMLENMGYHVEAVNSGEDAIIKVQARTAPYAAILMDVQLQNMNGLDATRHIRTIEAQKGFRNFIMGVTAFALVGDRERCLEAGMDDYLSKPIHPDLLEQKLEHHTQAA